MRDTLEPVSAIKTGIKGGWIFRLCLSLPPATATQHGHSSQVERVAVPRRRPPEPERATTGGEGSARVQAIGVGAGARRCLLIALNQQRPINR